MLERLTKGVLVAGAITLAGLASKALASEIVFFTHPNACGQKVTFSCNGKVDTSEVNQSGFVSDYTEMIGAGVGDTLIIRGNNYENSFIVKSTTDPNAPADACLNGQPDNKYISWHKITNELGVPDTAIGLWAWVKGSSHKDSTKVGREYISGTGHKGFIPLTEKPGYTDWVMYRAEVKRNDTTFQKIDSFKYTDFDGSSKLIDSIGLDTIPQGAVKEYEIPTINRTKPQPSIVSRSQDLVGQEIYDLSGRRRDPAKGLKQGVYFLREEDNSARRFLLVR